MKTTYYNLIEDITNKEQFTYINAMISNEVKYYLDYLNIEISSNKDIFTFNNLCEIIHQIYDKYDDTYIEQLAEALCNVFHNWGLENMHLSEIPNINYYNEIINYLF